MENNIPELRFPGFKKTWEQRLFFENIKKVIDFRGRTPKKLGLEWSENGYLALSALNVKNGYIDRAADAHYGNEELYNKWMGGYELKKGQVLFTTEAPMGNVAQVPDDNGYILSQRTIAFETQEAKMKDDFLGVLLSTPMVFNRLSSLSSGGTAKGISQRSLSKLIVVVPDALDEQKNIGEFFKKIDNTVSLHQQELTTLKQTKQGFLQKLFPKEGETVPEVRFPGFSGDWEERKFSDLVKRVASQSSNDKLPKVEFEDIISGEGRLNKDVSKKFDGRKGIVFEPGFILFGKLRPYLKNWLLPNFKGIALGDFWVFEPQNSHASFIYYLIQTDRYQTVANLSTGTKMPRSDWRTVSETDFVVPSIEEQITIGKFFKQLDETIELHEKELEALKETKKAFLQKMFV